jgi:hypothetical protein
MKIQLSSNDKSLMHNIAINLDDTLATWGLEDHLQIGDIQDLDYDTQELTKVILSPVNSTEALLDILANQTTLSSNLAHMLAQYSTANIDINFLSSAPQKFKLDKTLDDISENIRHYIQSERKQLASC